MNKRGNTYLKKSVVRNINPRKLSVKERELNQIPDTVYIGVANTGGQNYYALFEVGRGLIPMTRRNTRKGCLLSHKYFGYAG